MLTFPQIVHYRLWLLALAAVLALVPVPPVHAQEAGREIPLGFHINGGSTDTIQAASLAGADFVVAVFSWRDIEPVPGYHYWEQPDAVLRAAEFHGLEVIARLDRPPAWAVDGASPTPWNPDAYVDFVGRVVERYGDRLTGVIIWNEPNLALEWNGQKPDPAGYAQLLQQAHAAVKERRPHLPVAAAGLAMTLGDGNRAVNDLVYLEAMLAAGAAGSFDALAVHAYGFGAAPAAAPDAARLNVRRLELQQARLDAAGLDTLPLWITESGWRTWAPDPADEWQVVAPAEQADYSLALIAQTARNPRITRLGFWELTSGRDGYGYALWQRARPPAPAYDRLVERAAARSDNESSPPSTRAEIEILAPDVIIRLGDIGTLHPHWVHLHRGGENVSPDWTGEFFLTAAEAGRTVDLLLETMQVDQHTNRVEINGKDAGLLMPRPRPDPTSTWVTQRLAVPADLLQSGFNRVTIRSGLRNPVRQYRYWRWENVQLRNMRLAVPEPDAEPRRTWVKEPSPSGWAEINRIRRQGSSDTFWITGNRTGQLWQTTMTAGGPAPLDHQAVNLTDCTINDIAATGRGQVAATGCGLYARAAMDQPWLPAAGAGPGYSYVVIRDGDRYLAGFEDGGLWQAATASGPWRYAGLAGHSVFDIVRLPDQRMAVATMRGVYLGDIDAWNRLPPYPEAGGPAPDRFTQRLGIDDAGRLLARYRDQLWRWDDRGAWQAVGPPAVQDRLMSVAECCGAGTVVGTDRQGLWRQDATGEWTQIDGGRLGDLKITALHEAGDRLVLGTDNGLFWIEHGPSASFSLTKVDGLPATITALARHPDHPAVLLAATPAGLFRSNDEGRRWQSISPPWVLWDMAFGPGGRLFVARADGIAWTDDVFARIPQWTETRDMAAVTFFTVVPDTADADRILAGSWGNDIGISLDRGATIRSLGNGLETLSVLDIFRHSTPGQLTVGTIEGLYRSDDDGQRWFKLPGPLGRQTIYAVHQTAAGLLLAGAGDGLWRSSDYGASWARIESLPPAPVIRIGEDPSGDALLWAGTEGAGLWISVDAGATWHPAGLAGRTVYDVIRNRSGNLLAATETGIFSTRR